MTKYEPVPNSNVIWREIPRHKMAGTLFAGNMASALWLALVVTALVSPIPVSSEHNVGFRCPERSNCSCSTSGEGYYEMVCPMTGPSMFIVKFITGRYVQLQCQQNVKPEDYSMLPSLIIPNSEDGAESFSFSSCPLPTTPLADIVSRLGISKLRSLMFQTYGKNLSNTLKRHHVKGLEGVTRLVLSGNGLTDLPEDLFIDMRNLTWLNLRSNKIHLRPDLFKYISKLNLLELGHNDLPELPHGLFKHLTVLKQLNLWQNSLTNLTSDVFDGLEALEELDLSSNKIQTVPSDVFHKLPNLRLLNLYSNNLSSLPDDLFSLNPKLESLKLYDNKQSLRMLPEGLLSNLTKLTEVKLYRCKIAIVAESLLWGSTSIKNLSLKGNILTELPKDLLRDQVNLVELNLSDNLITTIPDGALRTLKQLKTLNLDRNRLEKLTGKLFAFLSSLEQLSIRENNLREVAFDAFFSTRQLDIVDLSYNKLSFMEDYGLPTLRYEDTFGLRSPFHQLEKIRFLNLSHNAITEIFSDWRLSTTSLRSLDLSFNKMLKISFVDINIVNNNLILDLRNNNISEIDFNSASEIAKSQQSQQSDSHRDAPSTHLVKVLVENNPLHCDCLLYNFVLYLGGKLDPQVRSLVTVESGKASCATPKDLQGRQLTELKPQEMFCPLDDPQSQRPPQCPKKCICNVRPFDVSLVVNCSASSIIDSPYLPDIKKLGLHHMELHFENNMINSLSQLSSNAKVYNQITRLFVGGNNVSSLTTEDIPNQIEILDVRNNNLRHINDSVSDVLSNSTTLKEMWISGNPIICDCENQPFLSFMQSNYKKVKDFTNVTCSDGRKVSLLTLGDLCGTAPAVIAFSVILALTGLLVGVMAALYYKYQEEIKVWLFAHNLCLWCITAKELDKDKLYDAFISFSHKDEDFVVNKLVPELEGGPHPFKICLHFRDWVAGEWIPTQIARSVEDSRRTLVILSPNFLESVWGRMEFRAAHSRALKEGRARVIVVLYGDIGPTDNLDPELQAYLSMNTYVKWGDPWFWDKLRYALPHPQSNKLHAPAHNVLKKKGFDDRLELIHPTTPTTPPGQNTPPAHQAHTNPLMSHVNSIPNGINGINGIKSPNMMNGTITMNGLKVNGNAKHSDV